MILPAAKRGEIWLAALDPTVGSEIRKTRPCLIISPDELNEHLRTVAALPLTTGSHAAPFRIAARFRDKDGLILPDQLRTLDRRRLVKKLGVIDRATLGAVLEVLWRMFAE